MLAHSLTMSIGYLLITQDSKFNTFYFKEHVRAQKDGIRRTTKFFNT